MRKMIMTTGLLLAAFPAVAQENTLPEMLRAQLARVCVGEADGSRHDWAAILWTLKHRASRSREQSLEGMLRYSSILRADTDRARQIRSLGTDEPEWGELPGVRRAQWEAALRFVDAWASGEVRDPCPHALHWGGTMDKKPSHRTTVSCGPTTNEFFYVPEEL